MDPVWDTVRDEFVRLLELPPEDRPHQLAAMPAEIRQEVVSLLDADSQAGSFLRPPDAPSQDAAGTRLGPYQLTRCLGSGGMGVVYLAQRFDGEFRREVAIKIAGGRLFAPEAERRFISERQILAQLDHPNIVRLLDGGISDGQRYFVMEYIEGQPLLDYARSRTVRDRLRLFLDVCSAVHYAHQRLIIHRDLKAANILVNSEGVVKLLDFGIAQIIEPGTAASGATLLRPVSLACMSPEQVRGDSLTLATDIYSLGVLLFELLTGFNPQYRDGDSYEASVQRVLHADPPPVRRHGRGVSRDLDAITRKAMAKDPRERYASVAELQADVERFHAGRPILALPPSILYQAGKFIRRNRALTVTAASLLVILIAAGVAITRQERIEAERFEHARRFVHSVIFEMQPSLDAVPGVLPLRKKMLEESMLYLEALSGGAGKNVDLLRELSNSYTQLASLRGNALGPSLGEPQLARKLMHQGESLLLRALSLAPEDPRLLRDAARTYSTLTEFDIQSLDLTSAGEHSRKALDYSRRNLRRTPGDFETRRIHAAALYSRGFALERIDSKAGIALFQEASSLYTALLTEKPEDEIRRGIMLCEWRLAERLLLESQAQPALSHSQRGVQLAEELLAKQPASPRRLLSVSTATGILCWNYLNLSDFTNAAALARRMISLRQRILRDDPGNEQAKGRLGEAFVYLAKSQLGSRQFREAKTSALEAIRIYENVLSRGTLAPVHRSGPAEARIVLADIFLASGNQAESCGQRRLGLAAYRALGTDQRLKVYQKIIEDAAQAVSQCEVATSASTAPQTRP